MPWAARLDLVLLRFLVIASAVEMEKRIYRAAQQEVAGRLSGPTMNLIDTVYLSMLIL